MNSRTIQEKIEDYIQANSGLDQHREYLGISKIAGCPRGAVLEYRNGIEESPEAHRMCLAGYEHEASVLRMLEEQGIADPYLYQSLPDLEVVAPFDDRLRGHVDGQTFDKELLEIKSLSSHRFTKLMERGKPFYNHFVQVQLYMRYGPWKVGFVVYRNRDTYQHEVFYVKYKPGLAEKFEAKAQMILDHIDAGSLPSCECGRHR